MELEKLVREKRSQWGIVPHEEVVTPLFAIWSKENQFLKNVLPIKLDGSHASHAQPTKRKKFLKKISIEKISLPLEEKKWHSIVFEELELHLPRTTNEKAPH